MACSRTDVPFPDRVLKSTSAPTALKLMREGCRPGTTAMTFLSASSHFISLTRPLLSRNLGVTQDHCEIESYRREESGTNFGACAGLRYG